MERFCSVPAVAGASMESEGERVPPHHSREIHEREKENVPVHAAICITKRRELQANAILDPQA